ncbi:TRAP transporter small permease [Albimonas pacifica]|uniref:TRAP transporter small permease protein n=1 Tax=Albimonas pacifica TaxID=1114924 RepID=A0A1I3BY25_9RHOB|nr:TRAP transporter small permease [Albimonas pacifica]SFH66849.1 TRAP-type C4-dicarboxylate transport system, small permease component [Albimonas pacifica]
MQAIGRVLNWISHGAAFVGAVAVVLMMFQIVLDVVMRNLFQAPVPMTTTVVAKWYMVACAFLPLAMSEIVNRHIAVEVVFSTLSKHRKRIVGGFACAVAFVVAAAMVRPFWFEAVKKYEAGSFIVENGRQLPVWQTYFFLPVGFALFAAVLLYRVVVLWTGAKSGLGETPIDADPEADPASEGV